MTSSASKVPSCACGTQQVMPVPDAARPYYFIAKSPRCAWVRPWPSFQPSGSAVRALQSSVVHLPGVGQARQRQHGLAAHAWHAVAQPRQHDRQQRICHVFADLRAIVRLRLQGGKLGHRMQTLGRCLAPATVHNMCRKASRTAAAVEGLQTGCRVKHSEQYGEFQPGCSR